MIIISTYSISLGIKSIVQIDRVCSLIKIIYKYNKFDEYCLEYHQLYGIKYTNDDKNK